MAGTARDMNHAVVSADRAAAAKAAPPPRLPFFASLRWRVVALLLLVVIVAVALRGYEALERRDREIEGALLIAQRQLQNTVDDEGIVLGLIRRQLHVLAANPTVAEVKRPECEELFGDLLKRFPELVRVASFTPRLERACTAPVPAPNQRVSLEIEWVRRAIAQKEFLVGRPHESTLTGRTVMPFVLPILDEAGGVRSILTIFYDPTTISAVIARLRRPPRSAFLLFRDDGVIVARVPEPEKFVGKNLRSLELGTFVDHVRREGSGATEATGVDGVRRIAVFAPFGGRESGLFLVLGLDRERFDAPVRRDLVVTLAAGGAAILAVFLLQWAAMTVVVLRPLGRLQQRVRAFAAGRTSVPPGRGGRGEIAALERDFDAMMAGIEAQRRALAEHARTLEAQVEARTRNLSEANAELEAYAHLVSHNLRAPMRQIAVHAANLVEDHGASLPEGARNTADRMAAAAGRAEESLAALHAFMRLAHAQLALTAVDLDTATVSALDQLNLDPATATVSVHAPLGSVRAHAEALRQVLASLIANAAKYVEPGAKAAIEVSSERRGAWRRLWIKDAGIGIAPEHHERVFAMFERLHGDEAYPGTGAGLALARRAVQRMGGTIGVESRLGAGSRFWIDLPEAEQPG